MICFASNALGPDDIFEKADQRGGRVQFCTSFEPAFVHALPYISCDRTVREYRCGSSPPYILVCYACSGPPVADLIKSMPW